MAIDNLSLSPIRVAAPAPAALPLAANNGPAPSIAADTLKLSATPVSLLANANTVAAANTAAVKPAAVTTPAPAGSYTVKPGDTLSGIAKDQLGDAERWPEIYDLNQASIADPDLIYPGQTFKLPGAKPTTADIDTTPVDTTPVDLEPTDEEAPETAELPAPAPAPIRKPIPRDFPPYGGPIRCFPHHPPVSHSDRSELLKQKLELLKMEEQVVRLELQLDEMLKHFPAPRPVIYKTGGAIY
jgi:LysM repeat protein